MRRNELSGKDSPRRTISFVLCALALAMAASFFSCNSDDLNDSSHKGTLRLNLAADTTGIKGGALTTKATGEFDNFLDINSYTVQVYSDEDTVESLLYKDFPEEIEIKEGSYTLKAFKGTNIPAAFDNPYFEGSKEFTVKEDMKTPLEVICTMANARVKAAYSEDFLKAYTDYTVMLKTSHLSSPFEIPQDEQRFAYLEVDKEGSPLVVAISLKRKNWAEAKVYTVTDPSITLKPKESITLNFSTDGKTGDGLALSVVLDDQLTEAELRDTIPDFMWKPFEKPTLLPQDFKNNDHIQISSAGLNVPPTLAFGVPSGIANFNVWRTVVGTSDTIKYDIATTQGATDAKAAGFSWGGVNLNGYRKNGQLHLENAFKQLEYIGADKEYEFIFFAKDNLPITNYTETIHFFVQKVYAAPTIKLNTPLPVDGVIEGEALKNDIVATLQAEGGIKEVIVSIKDAAGVEIKYTKDQLTALGASLSLDVNGVDGVLTIPKAFTEKLNALADADQNYTLDITVDAKEGIEANLSTTSTNPLLIKCPKYPLAMAPNEGDVFAKRAVLKANLTVGLPEKLKFQKKEGNSWVDVPAIDRVKEGFMQVDTLKGLTPNAKYAVRVVYANGHDRVSEVYEFTTEEIGVLPNAGFESWYREDGKKWSNIFGKYGPNWYYWYPWDKSKQETQGWNTINLKTIGGAWKYQYNSISGTMQTDDKKNGNYAALIRTVGWGESNLAIGTANASSIDPGYLYLGSYDANSKSPNYGYEFTSRPQKIAFYYKYTTKDDEFLAEIVVQNRSNGENIELGRGTFRNGYNIDAYTHKQVEVNYDNNHLDLKATHIYIVFKSGDKTSNDTLLEVPALANLSDGKYVGSKLYIDDVELIYE